VAREIEIHIQGENERIVSTSGRPGFGLPHEVVETPA